MNATYFEESRLLRHYFM